jgi:alkanesulfonate monooxygenase SsuD/methylene tetrahydromethanopterin reductase-like flavin-dependent oxidoreductase (luciferase family)
MGAGSTSSDQFVEHTAIIREELNHLNRSEDDFKISKRVYVAIDRDKSRAEEKLRTWFKANYGNPDLGSQVSLWGTSDEIIPQLQILIDSGAGMLMFNPVFDHMFHLETIAEEVIPFLTVDG